MNAILEDISIGLQNRDWKSKYSALMNLGSILNGPSQEFLSTTISPAMGSLLSHFEDESPKVRETTAWAFSKICES